MNAARRLVLLIAAAVPAGALAQVAADSARLDDFALPRGAIPRGAATTQVDQLPQDTRAPLPLPGPDRILAAPPRTEARGTRPEQLPARAAKAPPVQLSSTAQSRGETVAISSTADSAPGSVQRLSGRDRCDPRMAQAVLAACLRILELRADEFDAPAPPKLSPEQTILAEQRAADERLANQSANMRLRLAALSAPDVDLMSNQELASIYLNDQPVAPDPKPETPAEDPAAGLPAIFGVPGIE